MVPGCSPQIFGYFMKFAAWIWQGLSQLGTKPHVLPTKGEDVQDFLEKHYLFMPLRIAKCTVLSLQHEPHYSCLCLSLFFKNIKSFWHCAVWPGGVWRHWSMSGCEKGVLVEIWESSGISLPGVSPGVSTNVPFLAGQGGFCLSWCWWCGGIIWWSL